MSSHLPFPLVSILTSCYNGSKHIENYTKCLLSQTYRPLECIIVNDGSEDDSGARLEELSSKAKELGIHTKILHQKNTGNAMAISRAYGVSSGELIVCWDIDDVFYASNIELLVRTLCEHPTCSAALADGYLVRHSNEETTKSLFSKSHPEFKGKDLFFHLLKGTAWNWPGSYVVKSQVLEKLYGSRLIPIPRLWKNSQNLQLLLPASYGESAYCNQPVMEYYFYDSSTSHANPTYENNLNRILTYEDIRIQLLELMGLLHSNYKNIVVDAFIKIKLRLAYEHEQKQEFLLLYETLKDKKLITTEEKLLKCIICNESKIKQFFCKLMHKINTLLFT